MSNAPIDVSTISNLEEVKEKIRDSLRGCEPYDLTEYASRDDLVAECARDVLSEQRAARASKQRQEDGTATEGQSAETVQTITDASSAGMAQTGDKRRTDIADSGKDDPSKKSKLGRE